MNATSHTRKTYEGWDGSAKFERMQRNTGFRLGVVSLSFIMRDAKENRQKNPRGDKRAKRRDGLFTVALDCYSILDQGSLV